MNDPRLGASYRALRRRRGWRQRDVGAAAGVSQSVVSHIEAGHIDGMAVGTLRAVGVALDATLDLGLRWHGGALDRLLDERHAGLVGATVGILRRHSWETEIESSYSHYGERGSIDIIAWHPVTDSLLIVEVKTELIAIEATLRKLDEKVRLAPIVATIPSGGSARGAPGGQSRRPRSTARVLVLPATTTSRRHIARHARVLDVALPLRGADLRSWIRRPVGSVAGILLVGESAPMRTTNGRRAPATPHRIRRPASRSAAGIGGSRGS